MATAKKKKNWQRPYKLTHSKNGHFIRDYTWMKNTGPKNTIWKSEERTSSVDQTWQSSLEPISVTDYTEYSRIKYKNQQFADSKK